MPSLKPYPLQQPAPAPCAWCHYPIEVLIGLDRDSVPVKGHLVLCMNCGEVNRLNLIPVFFPGTYTLDREEFALTKVSETGLQAEQMTIGLAKMLETRAMIKQKKLDLKKGPNDLPTITGR